MKVGLKAEIKELNRISLLTPSSPTIASRRNDGFPPQKPGSYLLYRNTEPQHSVQAEMLEHNPQLLQIGILLFGVCSVTRFPVLGNILFL